jgi:hypothetical protein
MARSARPFCKRWFELRTPNFILSLVRSLPAVAGLQCPKNPQKNAPRPNSALSGASYLAKTPCFPAFFAGQEARKRHFFNYVPALRVSESMLPRSHVLTLPAKSDNRSHTLRISRKTVVR